MSFLTRIEGFVW